MTDASRTIVRVDFGHTLMRWTNDLETYVQSGSLPKTWFMEVPKELESADVGKALLVIFRHENARLRAREPNDINYLAPLDHRFEPVSFDARGPYPWEVEARISWESSNCFVVDRPDRIAPLLPSGFTLQVLMRMFQSKAIDEQTFRTHAGPRFANEGLLNGIVSDVGTYLDMGFEMGVAQAGWSLG